MGPEGKTNMHPTSKSLYFVSMKELVDFIVISIMPVPVDQTGHQRPHSGHEVGSDVREDTKAPLAATRKKDKLPVLRAGPATSAFEKIDCNTRNPVGGKVSFPSGMIR